MSCFSQPLLPKDVMPPAIFEDGKASEGDGVRSNLHSPKDTTQWSRYGTPTKTPRNETRQALGELARSSSRLNTEEAAASAANRLIDFTRGTPPGFRHGLILPRTPDSLLSHHKRRISKAARNAFYYRTSASQDSLSICSGSDSTTTEVHTDLGGPSRPIMHFRPNLWRHLEHDRSTLNLDLFWPLKTDQADDDMEEEDSDIFPIEDMRPLSEFRHLRSLQLNGMLQSYQKYIWRTCWLNPALEELTLEMALEPTMHDPYNQYCPAIDSGWKMKSEDEGSVEYLGQDGEGILSLDFGFGEYLDRQAMAMAKLDAAPMGGRLRYLPVVKLALSGFVIDSGAVKWFDPMRLRQIDLKHNCIDAGFALPANMRDLVKVSWPGKSDHKMVTVVNVAPEDIRMVTLRNGKVVNDNARLKPRISSLLGHRWFSTNRKAVGDGESVRNKVGMRLSSSNSMSSLRPTSSSGASRKSQDFVVV